MSPRPLSLLALALVAGCYGNSSPVPTTITLTLVDGVTKKPLTSSLVAVEVGGRYLPIPDTSKGNPNYTLSAATGPDGTLTLRVPSGPLGLHTFQNGYFYGTMDIDPYTQNGATVMVEPLGAMDVKPTVTNFAASTAQVAAGGTLDFSATVTHGAAGDPLSDEVLLIEPTQNFVRALDPPSAGSQGKGYPDGLWKTSFAAPKTPGTYTYSLVVSSELCVVSDAVSTKVVVQ